MSRMRKKIVEWIASPVFNVPSLGNAQELYIEIERQAYLIFQRLLPSIREQLLHSYGEALKKSLRAPEPNKVVEKALQDFGDSLPFFQSMGEEFLSLQERHQNGCSLEEEREILSLAERKYITLRFNRNQILQDAENEINETFYLIEKCWLSLEACLIQEFKPSLPICLQEEKLVEQLSSANPEIVREAWHGFLKRCYSEEKFLFVQQQDHPGKHSTLRTSITNIYLNQINFEFQAPNAAFENLTPFSKYKNKNKKSILTESNDEELLRFSFHTEAYFNCMSFGVARKALQGIPPAGKEPTPHNLWDVVQQLKDCGCIHVESLGFNLPVNIKSQKPTYLAAFVHDAGGGASGIPDCHVYRCFFDPIKKEPIWMELLKADSEIRFASKGGHQLQLIRGIPADPWNWFCKRGWNTFVGYWLIPPEAKFYIQLQVKENTLYFYRKKEAVLVT